ncbi:hypothetical protein B6I21_00735 [candidate division KSB1 bacterium 4572_119]|nr:MAG: hypothetical protein B6I21_00735 [candidate division KSB1 bacterium 4572_119]
MTRISLYSIIEGLKGLRRAKFSASVSIFTIFISLIMIAIFLIFIFNVHLIISQIQSRLEIEIFIDNSLNQEQVELLNDNIRKIEGVEEVKYISKDEAAEIFRKQFGQDVFDILDENPLPASFRLKLTPQFRSSDKTRAIFDQILQMEGIDEILYRQDLLALLEKYMTFFLLIALVIGLLLSFSSIILVSNTIKLVIFSRRKIIDIMKLVGATRGFIRRPYIVEGVIQGGTGGILAAMFFWGVFKIVNLEIPGVIIFDQRLYILLIVIGIVFGYIGSIFAIRKFLKY